MPRPIWNSAQLVRLPARLVLLGEGQEIAVRGGGLRWG